MISIAAGLVCSALAVWGIVKWNPEVVALIKGVLPILLLGGGLLTVAAGVSGIRDRIIDSQKEKTPRE